MSLASTGDLVAAARARARACLAFNVITLEHITALVEAAESREAPVLLQVSHNAVRYHGALDPIGSAMLSAARRASVPVGVHLDHAESGELVREAVELGFPSVMFDASTSDFDENVRATGDTVRYCHARDVWVEAELGEIGGKNGAHAPGARTDPAQAERFVAATGVDALAVAVGSSHAMATRSARLDIDLIGRLRAAVNVPLVLHGSSGVLEDDLAAGIRAGLTKINIGTRLNAVFTEATRHQLDGDAALIDPRGYLSAARSAVRDEAARLIDHLA